jgi:hypothetical protein
MPRPIRFLVTWSVALLVLLVVAAALNIFVNPYDVFPWERIAGINVLKPRIRDHSSMTKAFQVDRARPVTVVLGTSRAYLGIDSKSMEWSASYQPVYNYGLPGTNMSRSLLRELREAWSTGRLRHVIAFLDVPAFLDADVPVRGEEDERRLVFLDDGSANPAWREQRVQDVLLSVFTLGALTDSVRTVLVQNGGNRVLDLRTDGTATDADFSNAARAEGMNSVFAQKDLEALAGMPVIQRTLTDWHGLMPNLGVVRAVIGFCREHDITLTLIVGASHADVMELYRRAGLWPRVEQVKTDIAALVAEANSDNITAWDFFEYSLYTTEHLPAPGDRTTTLQWFWDPVHFQHALGDVMLQRVFQGTPADFGAPLTVATVAARNAAVRQQQQRFIGWHLACEVTDPKQCAAPVGGAIEAAR